MKFRLIDLLQCNCGSTKLVLTDPTVKEVPFADILQEVRCQKVCAFKRSAIEGGTVTPRDCMTCYKQEIVHGTVRCECGEEYPIVEGIPRFLPKDMPTGIKKIQDTFSLEWKMFRFGERNWGQDIESRKALFLQGMGATPEDLKGKLILDAGCGSGILSIEMAKTFGMEVVALDLAVGIQQAYEHNDSPYVHFVQGSVLDLPHRNHVFDYLYCAGVLVACPDTRVGFKAIIRTLKRGGHCFIWVYHPIDKTYHPYNTAKMRLYNWIRKNVSSRLPLKLQYLLYLSLMPAFLLKQSVERRLGKKQDLVSWREKMQALVDMFSPIYQNRHHPSEVLDWYSAEGFTNLEISDRGPYGFGVRGDFSGDSTRAQTTAGVARAILEDAPGTLRVASRLETP